MRDGVITDPIEAQIGDGSRVWHFAHVSPGARSLCTVTRKLSPVRIDENPMMKIPRRTGVRRVIVVVMGVGLIAVSLSAIFIRLADAPGVVVAAYRMVLASLLLLPWTLRALRTTPLTRANAPYAVLAGLLLGLHFATWISALSYTSVAAGSPANTASSNCMPRKREAMMPVP